MPDLVVVVPSRGRPERCAELVEACVKTCTASTVLLVSLDTDDPRAPEYAAPAGSTVFFHYGEHAGHVGAINAAAERALADFQPFAVAKLDDDHRPRTVGWDARYLEALRGLGTGIVYGNDLLQGERLPTAPAMTADIVRVLGHVAPPVLRHLYCDDYWRDLCRQAGCLRYLPDVVVEHMHPAAGKAAWDDGYARANAPERYRDDGLAWAAYQVRQLMEDAAKVRALRSVKA